MYLCPSILVSGACCQMGQNSTFDGPREAARAFANWTAYQGRGVLSIVRGLEAALALARVEAARECRNAGRALDADLLKQAFRAADFVLNHIAVGEDLASAWSRVEDTEHRGTEAPGTT